MENNLLAALFDDDFPINLIGNVVEQLAEPAAEEAEGERAVIPRNENYYEVTIRRYMGDLFKEHFRMNRNCFEELLRVVGNNPIYNANRAVPLEKELLFTIWLLAKPECFLAAGDRFGIAPSSGHNIFTKIINVLLNLLPQYVTWPGNRQVIIETFHARSHGFPGVVGAIDGCHIPIKQPEHNPVDYYNRKEYHSIILQAICDHKMLFLDIFVGMPGRMHDARVLRLSPVYRRLEDRDNPILEEHEHIIGDSAYPILQNLLTPYRDNGHLNNVQVNFNIKLSGLRATVERAFALLLGKFRRLKFLDVGDPDFGTRIICAAGVLHNFIILNDEAEPEHENVEPNPVHMIPQENVGDQDVAADIGLIKRDQIAQLLFNAH